MTREEALKYCLANKIPDLAVKLKHYNVSHDTFVDALISGNSLTRSIGIAQPKASRLIQSLFPDKPKTTIKLCTWLLETHELKACTRCKLCFPFSNFYIEKGRRSGFSNNCKSCDRTRESSRQPKWADIQAIALIYANTPKGCHVDHIIPLNGKNVCGLHVEGNLTYLPEKLNMAKGNKMPDDFFMNLRPDKPPTLVEINS